ncbi:MAG: TetR family transcriptional regulator [Thalassobius sp.]|nr:TetR family transcriptional regulator [Thalassovita sp.]
MSKLDTKERIILAASNLFWTYGIRNVKMDDIANELSISKKTIYQFFKDKNEIVTVSVKSLLEKERMFIEEKIEQSIDAMDELFISFEYFKKFFRTLNPSLSTDLENHYPEAWEVYLYYKNNIFKNSLINSMKRGIKEGIFRDDFDIEIMARMRMQQFQLAFDSKVFPLQEFDFFEIQIQFIVHFVLGISTIKGFERIQAYRETQKKKT